MATQIQQYVKAVLVLIVSGLFLFACSNGSNSNENPDVSGRQSEFLSADVDNMMTNWLMEDSAGAVDASDGDEATREIEEADIIEIDGDHLYILNSYRGLAICDISVPDNPSITGRCSINGEPLEMYVRGSTAYVIVSVPQVLVYAELDVLDEISPYSSGSISRVEVIDIEDPSNPSIVDTIDLEGEITDSRIVGDILYAVSSEAGAVYYGLDSLAETSSTDDSASTSTEVDGDAISSDELSVYVASIDLSDSGNIVQVDRMDFGGLARYIHVTETAIFVASASLDYSSDSMTITYVDISDPSGLVRERGEFEVQGTIQDDFKMDYHEGYFRACTYEWDSEKRGLSRLYVFDVNDPDTPVEVGGLELGEGEQLFATRFDGDRAYMVTFEQKDPLWVIDLSDPANPEIKGELEVPGWSTYIQAMGDHLVAMGIDDTEDSWRVAVSLFDVSDPEAPGLIERVSFGEENGWSWSTANQDEKSLTVLEDMGLILLPYSTVSYSSNSYGMENRLQLIDYSPDDLTARGWVTQKGSVLRGRSYSDRLFSVSTEQLQVIDASDRDNPLVSADLTLSENVVDFISLENGYGVKVTESGGAYALQVIDVDSPEEVVGETALGEISYTSHFINGNLVYLIDSRYGNGSVEEAADGEDVVYDSYAYTTSVTVFDFETPSAPIRMGNIDIEGYYSQPVYLEENYMVYPYSYSQQIVQVQDDLLAFVAVTPYDDGDDVVSILDLSDPDNPALVAKYMLEEEDASGAFALSGVLYYSYTVDVEDDEEGRSQTRYYLGRIDLSDPSNPENLPGINIPGICLGMDDTGAYAYTVDNQWLLETDSGVEYTFNTVRIEDDTAYLMGETILPQYYGSYTIADGLAYAGGSSWWYDDGGILIIDLTDPENLVQYDADLPWYVTGAIDAKDRTAFFRMWGGIGCYDVQDPGSPELIDFQYGYTYNSRMTFSGDRAYLPMGYYGLWVKELSP